MTVLATTHTTQALSFAFALLLQSTLLLTLGLLAAWLLRRRGPALRAFVLQMTLAGVVLGAAFSALAAGHVQPVWSVQMPTVKEPTSLLARSSTRGFLPKREDEENVSAESAQSSSDVPTLSTTTPASPPLSASGRVDRLAGTGGVLGALWCLVSAMLLLWLAACQTHLWTLGRRAKRLTKGPAAEILLRLAQAAHVRPPQFATSSNVQSPFLAGLWQPTIFLPAGWDSDNATLPVVLAHELAHLKRRDIAWTWLLRLTTAIFWPQPLLWVLGRQLEQATEEACDLLALTPELPAKRYADCLLTLAETALPTRTERVLGAGVVPVKSSVGRRICAVLDSRRRTLLTWPKRVALIVVAGALALALALALLPMPQVSSFDYAKAQGWSIAPVRVVHMQPAWLRFLQPQPPNLSRQDIVVLRACSINPFQSSPYYNALGSTVALRNLYRSLVARYPGNFYPEDCLANWYLEHHDLAHFHQWEKRALHDAPAVIAGRILDGNGKPVANAVYNLQLGTYQAKRFQSFQSFAYTQLAVTDQEGCYYIPVFPGIYRTDGPGLRTADAFFDAQHKSLDAYSTGPDTTDWMKSSSSGQITMGMVATSHMGVLPTVIALPQLQMLAPIGPVTTGQNGVKTTTLTGNTLDFRWTPIPGAKRYLLMLYNVSSVNDNQYMILLDPKAYTPQAYVTQPEYQLSLLGLHTFDGSAPILNHSDTYQLQIMAFNNSDTEHVNALIGYLGYEFIPANAPPIPLTKANFLRALGPGGTVISLVKQGNTTTVTGTAPNGTFTYATMSQKWYPLFNPHPADTGTPFDPNTVQNLAGYTVKFTPAPTPAILRSAMPPAGWTNPPPARR